MNFSKHLTNKGVPFARFCCNVAMGRLSGKVAIVTGSTEGIGFAIAQRLGQDGAHVVISSRNKKKVDKALEELKSENLSVSGVSCQVNNAEHRRELIRKTVDEQGGIDILVSNAGCSPHFGPMLEISEDAWDKLWDTNVKAGFMLCKEVVPHMRTRGSGSIVFVSSVAAYQPFPLIGPYSVTKTALLGLTQALSKSLAGENIRVNCIAPGVIKTKFAAMLTQADPEEIGISMKRFGTPQDCAGAVSFLVSDDASYVTGETIALTGGVLSRL
ncbi:dehydrogenase/reductase SDR family member 4-like [Watersipora subatra]|uniref:dehydrogenase/reductase SDR family member 4-like n=1 Tax=Watersipora subatra TaxID=2589382 RepID=UPI00355B1CEE